MIYGKITKNFTKRTEIQKEALIYQAKQIDEKQKRKQESNASKTSIRKLASTTLYYAELRIKQRTQDITRINRLYDLIDTRYDQISFNICSKDAILTNNEIAEFSEIFPLLKTYPDLVLDIATIFPDPPKEIIDVLNSNLLWKPDISQVQNAFIFDPVTNTALSLKYRYLVNMDGNIVRDYLNDRKSVPFNIKVNCELFLQYSNQSRWNNLWTQIAVTMFYTDTISQAKALQNLAIPMLSTRRKGTELITLQTIAYILKRLKVLPFTIRQDGKLDISHTKQEWTTGLIPLLYSLLELSKEERGCNVNADFLIPIITYRIVSAYTSFETETLDRKGIYPSMIKLVTSSLKRHARYNYDSSMQYQRIKEYMYNNEVYLADTELDDIKTEIREKGYKPFLDVFDKYLTMIDKGTPTQNTELARWLIGILLTMGNAGIYYKTSMVLEKEKAVESKTLGTLNFPKPSKLWIFNDTKIDLETDWDSGDEIFSMIANKYKELVKPHLHVLNGNMQEWYYSLLTNRSQGFKVDVEKFVNTMNIDQELLKDLRNVGQVRVASFLLDNEPFSVFPRFIEQLALDGACTDRFQNNRQRRVVEIVSNVEQIAYAIPLKIFEEHKSITEDIAVGKQIGGIVDMELQLKMTGLDNTINFSSDVKAMDLHTQPNIAVMFLKMLSELIIEGQIGPNHYFPFSTSELLIENVFDHRGQRIHGIQAQQVSQTYYTKKIPALAQALLYIVSQRLNKKYVINDTVFNVVVSIFMAIFESGRYDTGAQHSFLLYILSLIVHENLRNQVIGLVGKIHTYRRKFGDDSYEAVEYTALNTTQKKNMIRYLLDANDKVLKQVGLVGKAEMSSYYGDFLQQMAFCGVVVPKSARSSIYTDEQNALANRDLLDLITNMANIITASAQRSYAPENVMSLVYNIWATNRLARLLPSKSISLRSELKPYLKVINGKTYLEYPYILISLPPLNFPNQTFEFENGLVLPASSHVRTVGLCKLNYVWNQVIPMEIRRSLFNANIPLVGEMSALDPVDVFVDCLKGTNIVESLLFSSYNRAQELSKSRFERLADPIVKMGSVAKNYFDSTKLMSSAMAASTLRTTYGITLPDNLLYYMKPIEQVKKMFEARAESTDESIGLNDAYIRALNKIFAVMPKKIKESIVNTCIFWDESNEKIEGLSSESPNLPLMPGYHKDSDYYRAMLIVGNAFKTSQRQNRALVTFTSRYGGSYNMEAIHRFGMKAKAAENKGSLNAMSLFYEAMQLPPKIRAAVEQLFANENTVLLSELYQSGFQPEQNFAISDSLARVRNYITFNNGIASSGRETMIVMLRDYLFLTANREIYAHKYSPVMPPRTFVNFNLRSILSNMGVSAL